VINEELRLMENWGIRNTLPVRSPKAKVPSFRIYTQLIGLGSGISRVIFQEAQPLD